MKVSLKRMVVLAYVGTMGLLMTSCSEDTIINNYDIDVEMREVRFGTKSILAESDGVFEKGAKGTATDFDTIYKHQTPEFANVIFVADETKGKYTQGQVIEYMNLSTNTAHTITIPALKYKVYATNYNHDMPQKGDMVQGKWYTNNNAFSQMPGASTTLLMHGSATIDYSVANATGEVTMTNPYSAVMIRNNENLHTTVAPLFQGQNGRDYILVDNNKWYLLYIRANTTNTKVTLAYNVNNTNFVNLTKNIVANKIYQYTYKGVGSATDDGFIVNVNPLENGEAENIDLF